MWVWHAQSAIKPAGAEKGDAVVKNLDLKVGRVCVIAVCHGVEQRLAQCRQGVGKALLALQAAIKFKRHADVRYDEFMA